MATCRVVFLSLALAAGCAHKQEAPEAKPEAPVQVASAQRAEIHRIVTAEGVLYPIAQAAIMPKISAPVRAFHVNKGDRVRARQPLVELENRDLVASVAETKGLYEQAQSAFRATTSATVPEDLRKAQLEVDTTRQATEAAQKVYDSRQELLRQGAIARRSLDEANVAYVQARNQYEAARRHLETIQNVAQKEQVTTAQAQVDAAKARYEAAQAQLAYTRIESPIDGVVTDRPLYEGEMAAADKPLVTVMDISSVIARANVSNAQLLFMKIGQPATIAAQDGTSQISGKVTVVSPALDPNSTTAEVWVQAANPKSNFHPGSTVNVSILTQTVTDALVVPSEALLPSDEGGSIVKVVDKDSIAHARKIEIGIREQDKVQITKGLQEGERVIVAGGLGIEDKAKVKVEAQEKDKDEKK